MVKILELEQITCNGMRNSKMTTFASGSPKLRDEEINVNDMYDESCSSCCQKQKFLPKTNDTCTKTSSSILRFIKERFKASTSKIMKTKERNCEEKQIEESVLSKVGTSSTKRAKSCGHISLRPGKFKTKTDRRSKLGKCDSEPLQKYKKVVRTKRAVRKVRGIANTCNVIYLCIFHKRKRRKQRSQIVQTEIPNSFPTPQRFCDVKYNTLFWTSGLVAVKQSTSQSYYDSSEEALSGRSCDSDQNKFPKRMVNALEKKILSNSSFVCYDSDQIKTETEYETEFSFNFSGERSEDEAKPSESSLEKDEIENPLTYEKSVNSLDDISSNRNSLGNRNVKMEIYSGIQALCKKSWFGKNFRKKTKKADVQVRPVTENARQREGTLDASCNCSDRRYTAEAYKPGSYRRRSQSEASDVSTDDDACNTRVGSYCGFYGNSCKRKKRRSKFYHDSEEEESMPETSNALDESIESERDVLGETSSGLRKDNSRHTSKVSSEHYDEIYKKQSLKEDAARRSGSYSHDRSRIKSHDRQEKSKPEAHDGKSKAKADSRRKMSPSVSASRLHDERSRMKSHDSREIPHESKIRREVSPQTSVLLDERSKRKSTDEKESPTEKHKPEAHIGRERAERLSQGRKEHQTENHKPDGASHLHASLSLLDIPSQRRKSDTDSNNARKASKRLSATVPSDKNQVEETDSAVETQGYCSSCCTKAKAKAAKVMEAVGKKPKRSGVQSEVLSEASGSAMENFSAEGKTDQSVSHSQPFLIKSSKESLFDAISEQDENTSTENISDTKDVETAYATSDYDASLSPDKETTTTQTPSFERDHRRITHADKHVQSTKENVLLPDFIQNEKNVLDGIAALLNQIFHEMSKQPFRKCICKISQTPNKQGLLNATNLGKGYQTALYVIRKKLVPDEDLVPTKLGEPQKTLSINTDKLKLEIKTDEDGNWLIDRVGNLEMTIIEKQDARAQFIETPTNTDGVQLKCTSCLCVLASKPDMPKDENDTSKIKSSDKSTTAVPQTQKTSEVALEKSFDRATKTQETVASKKDSELIQKTQELDPSQNVTAKTQTLPDMVLLEELPLSSKPSHQTNKPELVSSEKSPKAIQQIPEIVITRAPHSEPIIHKPPDMVSSKHTLKPPVQQTQKLSRMSSKQTHTTPELAAASKSTLKPVQEKSSHHIQESPKQDQKKPKMKTSETPELQPHAVIHVYKKIAGEKHLPADDPRNFVVKIQFHPSDTDTQSEEIKSCSKDSNRKSCPSNGTCCKCDRKPSSPPTSALLFKQLKSTTTADTLSPSSAEKCSIVELPSQESYMKKVKICVPKRNAGSQALIKHHIMQQCPEMMNVKSQTRKPCVKCACPAVAPILPDGQKTCCS